MKIIALAVAATAILILLILMVFFISQSWNNLKKAEREHEEVTRARKSRPVGDYTIKSKENVALYDKDGNFVMHLNETDISDS